ncbi:non-ribosomal peptide synthetase [Vallitalea guaymasensis]|uniref:non-ribosomal peptide synthetase n=1 Tax=Vallitalea guaymasensis TaxID=1185412 RepID=UPI00272C961C|nr:non-ribosomal peptide synthetase [Vallitalea guaymasensis]
MDTVNMNEKNKHRFLEVNDQDIAIIGICVKLPMAETLDELWNNISNGKNCVSEIPESRLEDIIDYMDFCNKDSDNTVFPKAAYLESIDKFDYSFFNLSPRQAKLMDPHHRIFLETAWNAFEDAGYGKNRITGTKTGVFVGFNPRLEYKKMIMETGQASMSEALTGSLPSAMAGTISYLLDLKGPNMNINTACSSSLTALHTACQSIRNKECDMALTGSIRLSITVDDDIKSADIGIASPDGKAKVFDDSADGSSGGEGSIAVLLKSLGNAIEDRDNIYAVIKGSSINSDGRSASLTSPNAAAQTRLICKAWENAGVEPESITYIETHGTGTKLGDPIEMEGIKKAFDNYTNKKQFCAVGSVKTNLGHLDTAAGLLGVVKAVCALKNKQIPPNIHFNLPNRKINFEDSAVYISNRLMDWNTDIYPRRCGVTSFGLSGTNVHVVLEEAGAYKRKKREVKEDIRVLKLSGHSTNVLKRLISTYYDYIKNNNSNWSIDELCYTANTGRGDYTQRITFIFKSVDELMSQMDWVIKNGLNFEYEKGILYGRADNYDDDNIDENQRERITEIRKTKDLDKKYQEILELCKLYVKGIHVEWNVLYEKKRYHKISLPVYPFEQTRCWIDVDVSKGNVHNKSIIDAPVNMPNEYETKVSDIKVTGDNMSSVSPVVIEMAQIVAYSLGYDTISMEDSFFQLGGDSIQALKVINRINDKLDVHIEVADLLKNPTISQLGEIISVSSDDDIITPIEEQEYYELSSAQKRIYYPCLFEGSSTRYNLINAVIIEGDVDTDRLKNAFQSLVDRHEVMRTGFHLIDGIPKMKIYDNIDMDIEYSQSDGTDIENIIKDFRKPFDLEKAPLVRIKLVRISSDRVYLIYDVHHIIFDSYSFGVVLEDLIKIYNGSVLPELKVQYKDFAAWHNNLIKTDKMKKQADYWFNEFKEKIPYTIIPPCTGDHHQEENSGDSLWFHLSKEQTEKLKQIAAKNDSTLFMTLLSVYGILVSRYISQEEIIIGSPIAGRNHKQTENLIGDFINLLAIRMNVNPNKNFNELLNDVKEKCTKAYENQDYPFQEIIQKLNVKRQNDDNSLFNVLFAFHSNLKNKELRYDDWKILEGEYDVNAATLDLTMDVEETNEDLMFNLSFSNEAYDRIFIQQMIDNYKNILEQVINNQNIKLDDIALLSHLEEEKMLIDMSKGEKIDISSETINDMFGKTFREYSSKTAVVGIDGALTYKELDEKSLKLAAILQENGIGKDKVVGLLLRRTSNMIVGMVGILRSGGAYLPIDPEFPQEHINYMLKDSKTDIILSEKEIISRVGIDNNEYKVISIDEIDEKEYITDNSTKEFQYSSDALAYIIYTSGSTGKAKGVMIEHKNLYNFVLGMKRNLELKSGHTMLALTTVSFDIWGLESICSIAQGLEVIVADENQQKDMFLLRKLIMDNNVDIIQATPSRVRMMLEDDDCMEMFEKVKLLLVGGEKLDKSLLDKVKKVYKGRIFNMYGPTETTIWSSTRELTESKEITVGRPILNTTFYVMDNELRLRPLGCPGDLYIGGSGLARGYVNNENLTKEKFILNPYNKEEKIYKTGDTARWLANGQLDILGRNDNQVKLNGHRIELGEIETILMQSRGIQSAVVLKWEEENSSYLCAYVTGQEKIDINDVKESLKSKLPYYMLPKFYVQLDDMPLTLNGKIDRKQMPKPKHRSIDDNFIGAQNDIEKKIVSIWEEILNTENIGLNDNFFDVGGDSVLLVQMQSRIKKEFNCEISIADFFDNSTVSKIEQLLITAKDNNTRESSYGTIHMPEKFFSKNVNSSSYANMSYTIKSQEHEMIKKASKVKDHNISEWLLSIFTYHLYGIAESEDFTMYTTVGDIKNISIMDIVKEEEINDVKELEKFLDNIKQKVYMSKKETINNIGKDNLIKLDNEIGMIFVDKPLTGSLTSIYDVIIEIKESADSIKINMEYSEKLSRNDMKIFLSQYIKLIKAVSELFLK